MSECPRWRLTAPHYLNIPMLPDGTRVEWEHKETNRENGRAVRKLYQVPLLLDPDSPVDHNYPGEIVVAHEVEGARYSPRDYIFVGAPTRDMEPLNPEAEAISDQHRARWINPVDTLPANGGMNEAESKFMQAMVAEFAKQAGAAPIANTSVPREEYDALKDRLAKLEAMIAAQNNPPAPAATRRV